MVKICSFILTGHIAAGLQLGVPLMGKGGGASCRGRGVHTHTHTHTHTLHDRVMPWLHAQPPIQRVNLPRSYQLVPEQSTQYV